MSKRIIIIEDSRDVGRMLQAALSSVDPQLSVQLYISAEEALLDATRNPVDLLVSDIRLPGKSGLELVREMRQRRPACRVIIITGITDPAILAQAKQIEVDGFFQKPLNMTAFLETFRAALQKIEQTPQTAPETAEKPAPSASPRRGTGWLRRAVTGTLRLKEKPTSLSQQLMALRQSLGAQAVAILDEHGKSIEVAGELLPDLWTAEWEQRLIQSQEGLRALAQPSQPAALVLPGQAFHLVLTLLGEHNLVAMLRPGRGAARPGAAVDEILSAQPAILEALQQMLQMPSKPPVEAPRGSAELAPENPFQPPVEQPQEQPASPTPAPELDGAALDEFAQKLSSSAQALNLQQATDFWEDLVNQSSTSAQEPDGTPADQPDNM